MKQRRRYLVDGRYQTVQALAAVLGNILAVLLAAALMSWVYLILMDGSLAVDHNRAIPVYLLSALGLIMLVSIWASLHRSRAVAGMMHYLYTVLDNASRGIYPEGPLAFRKSDYPRFRRLAGPLNACLSKMQASGGPGVKTLALEDLDLQALDLEALASEAEALAAELGKPAPDYLALGAALENLAAGIREADQYRK